MVRNLTQSQPTGWLSWLLAFFLGVAFLIGGGARSDIQSLVVLRPLASIILMLGLWFLTREHIRSNRFLFVAAGALIALPVVHLLPLPPAIWTALPGRELAIEIDRTLGINGAWRPISLAPSATWNALFALAVPLAAFVLLAQADREKSSLFLRVILIAGLLSAIIGLLQAIGPPKGPFHFYRITNNDMAVGLFANRNHQAVFLATLFPMLAVYASAGSLSADELFRRRWVALAAGAFLIPLILVTGSRAGLIAGVIGLGSAMLLYRSPAVRAAKKSKGGWQRYTRHIIIATGAVFFVMVTILMTRAEAISRLLAPGASEDLRWQTLGPILDAAWIYAPVGSGVGSFVEVYQVHEPIDALSINYVNHAHNDWVEVVLTAGLPGALLLLVALAAYLKSTYHVFSSANAGLRHIQYARLGAVIILILGLASVADYPLRVPSLACLFVLAAVWLSAGMKSERADG